jgi:integrase
MAARLCCCPNVAPGDFLVMAQKRKSPRKLLTDTYIKSRKPAATGGRDETIDLDHHRLRLRVTDAGHKSFIYLARFPGSPHPARRWLGDYPTTTLTKAREKAREWDDLLAKGIDPRTEQHRIEAEAERATKNATGNTFEARAGEYLRKHCKHHRQARETGRIIDKVLRPAWEGRPVDIITSRDVKDVITGIVDRGKPAMARNVLTVAKSFFDWAQELEYVETSPAAAIRPKKLIGVKNPRQRILDDNELRAFWRASEQLAYPFGELYRLLLLTGVRLREGADARWREFDLGKGLWTIPPERFKSDATHIVPLSRAALELLNGLPRFGGGDFLFSTTFGAKAVRGFSKAKAEIDELMAAELGEAPLPRG